MRPFNTVNMPACLELSPACGLLCKPGFSNKCVDDHTRPRRQRLPRNGNWIDARGPDVSCSVIDLFIFIYLVTYVIRSKTYDPHCQPDVNLSCLSTCKKFQSKRGCAIPRIWYTHSLGTDGMVNPRRRRRDYFSSLLCRGKTGYSDNLFSATRDVFSKSVAANRLAPFGRPQKLR